MGCRGTLIPLVLQQPFSLFLRGSKNVGKQCDGSIAEALAVVTLMGQCTAYDMQRPLLT